MNIHWKVNSFNSIAFNNNIINSFVATKKNRILNILMFFCCLLRRLTNERIEQLCRISLLLLFVFHWPSQIVPLRQRISVAVGKRKWAKMIELIGMFNLIGICKTKEIWFLSKLISNFEIISWIADRARQRQDRRCDNGIIVTCCHCRVCTATMTMIAGPEAHKLDYLKISFGMIAHF